LTSRGVTPGDSKDPGDREDLGELPRRVGSAARAALLASSACESGPLRAVHLSRHKWPEGLVN